MIANGCFYPIHRLAPRIASFSLLGIQSEGWKHFEKSTFPWYCNDKNIPRIHRESKGPRWRAFNLPYTHKCHRRRFGGSNGQYRHLKVQASFDAQAYAVDANKYNFTFLSFSRVLSTIESCRVWPTSTSRGNKAFPMASQLHQSHSERVYGPIVFGVKIV